MDLLFGTGNEMKYNMMKERLKEFKEINVITPKMIGLDLDIVEDGNTPEENAIKKAKQYYEATKIPTIAEDSGLYIDKFSDEEQPGLFVKRINGVEGLSDEVILKYYIDKLNEHGKESLAAYHTGVCLIDKDGNVYSDCIEETKFLLTSKPFDKSSPRGGVLECISYDVNADKYFQERSEEEYKAHYKKLDDEYRKLVKKYILKK